jgi:hypothetical protein
LALSVPLALGGAPLTLASAAAAGSGAPTGARGAAGEGFAGIAGM